MAQNRKFYVVWEGRAPGIYDSWEECRLQVENFEGARYKSFPDQESATEAFRGNPKDYIGAIAKIAAEVKRREEVVRNEQIVRNAIAVDGAASGNPGPIEYRGVDIASGHEIFRVGPLQGGTNNIAEFLALVHALALLDKRGDRFTTIYSDSRTAQSWIRKRKCCTKIEWQPYNAQLKDLVDRAERWLQTHQLHNPIIKWDTDNWGEIPADFGRK